MHFKTPEIGLQWGSLHPELRTRLGELDEFLNESGLPTFTVTDAIRTPDEQEGLWWGDYLKKGYLETEARAKARAQFSWHLVATAADFRGFKPWGEERARVWGWLKQHCASSEWELLEHDVGTGRHFHLAYRDFGRRKKWEHGLGWV